jgi:hypothetical protein
LAQGEGALEVDGRAGAGGNGPGVGPGAANDVERAAVKCFERAGVRQGRAEDLENSAADIGVDRPLVYQGVRIVANDARLARDGDARADGQRARGAAAAAVVVNSIVGRFSQDDRAGAAQSLRAVEVEVPIIGAGGRSQLDGSVAEGQTPVTVTIEEVWDMSSVPARVTPERVPELPIRVAPLVRSIVPPLIVPPASVREALNVAVVPIARLPPESVIGS